MAGSSQYCSLCNEILGSSLKITTVKKKGLETFITKSKARGDKFWESWEKCESITVHESCRSRYSSARIPAPKKRKIEDATVLFEGESQNVGQPHGQVQNIELIAQALNAQQANAENIDVHVEQPRAEENMEIAQDDDDVDFSFAEACILCGELLDRRHNKIIQVTSQYDSQRTINVAQSRKDDYGEAIVQRFKLLMKKNNIKAYYHDKCKKTVIRPVADISKSQIRNDKVDEIFDKVSYYIENSNKIKITYDELKYAMGEEQLSKHMLLEKVKEKYGQEVIVIRHVGRQPIFFYSKINIIQCYTEWLADPQSIPTDEKKFILEIAAEIINHDITSENYESESYPPARNFLSNVESNIPQSLKIFLNKLLFAETEEVETVDQKKTVKRNSIAHAIMSCVRPKLFVSKLQLALGTYIYRKTGSRLIINLLHKLGLSSSYYNIQLYEASTIMNAPEFKQENSSVQFIFDNTDHNLQTLDGRETFHSLGGIAVYTPTDSVTYEGESKKLKDMAQQLVSVETVPIKSFSNYDKNKLNDVKFIETDTLKLQEHAEPLKPLYITYLLSKYARIEKVPLWRGFMESIQHETSYSTSHIRCLPFIHGPPSDLNTLHTALLLAANEAKKIGQKTVFVTFDQPLYIKARSIIAQSNNPDLKNVIIRQGGFHLLMSYLGAIGTIMEESGLEDLWATAYASESVKKMMSGHAFARALRAHILTFTALGIHICERFCDSVLIKKYMTDFLATWTRTPLSAEACNTNDFMQRKTKEFLAELDKLEKTGSTPKLWTQYMRAVINLLQFVESERLGKWDLHLQSMERMLPILHAAGHFAYAKSLQIYLQDLANLRKTMEANDDLEGFLLFTEKGYFTIRRTNKEFSGVWSNMVIEQSLNRFFGTDLKHGRGVTPSVVARYLLGMPAAYDLMECLEAYANFTSVNSEQHVDLTNSRMKIDNSDIEKFLYWINKHEPFKPDRQGLMSLSSGIIAGDNVNCHMAVEQGRLGMASMVDKNLVNISLSAATSKVRTLSLARRGVHIHEVQCSIDSNMLFHRIAAYFHGDEDKTRNALKYELSPFPQSLFDEQGLMRKTAKAELYKVIKADANKPSLVNRLLNVIDGGWLLHRITWSHGKCFKDVVEQYRDFVTSKYGNDCTIVFDGYAKDNLGIKSYERFRRKEKVVGPDMEISMDKEISITQKKFLANVQNKRELVELLAQYLNEKNVKAIIAKEDADVDIVQETLKTLPLHAGRPVAVVGNDVDLLALLISLSPESANIYYHKIASGKNAEKLYAVSDHIDLKPFILFAHAFCGSDTTNAFFNIGKKSIITLLQKDVNVRQSIKKFYEEKQTIDELYPISEKLVKLLYAAETTLSLVDLRYTLYLSNVRSAKKQSILALLPPTESALREHTKRVYYQIQILLGKGANMEAEQWGWKKTSFMYIPTFVGEGTPPAPDALLKKVFCSCQRECTSRCGCRKAGLPCTQFCKNCNGETCDNKMKIVYDIQDNDDVDIISSTLLQDDIEIPERQDQLLQDDVQLAWATNDQEENMLE